MVERKGEWLSAMVGEELVMMNALTGSYLGISAVGARIWDLIESPRNLDDLCAELTREFEVTPDVCRADVMRFIDEMQSHGAIALVPPPAA